jgi:hypothetical protein
MEIKVQIVVEVKEVKTLKVSLDRLLKGPGREFRRGPANV